MSLLRKPLWMIVRLITVGQLPADIRQAYGLRWGARQRVGFRMARGAGHLLRRLFPNALGRSPLVNFARRRARGEFSQSTEPVTSDASVNQQVLNSEHSVQAPMPATTGAGDEE